MTEDKRHAEALDALQRIYALIPAGNAPTSVESSILAVLAEVGIGDA